MQARGEERGVEEELCLRGVRVRVGVGVGVGVGVRVGVRVEEGLGVEGRDVFEVHKGGGVRGTGWQPEMHGVAASITWGCSLHHTGLQGCRRSRALATSARLQARNRRKRGGSW